MLTVQNGSHIGIFHYAKTSTKVIFHQSCTQDGMHIMIGQFLLSKNCNTYGCNLLIYCSSFICQLESIGALEQFLMKHRKDYIDPHRTTEQERDSIEHEVRFEPIQYQN